MRHFSWGAARPLWCWAAAKVGTIISGFFWRGAGTETAGRITWVDAGKGLAIALVVLFHAARWLDGLPNNTATWQWVNDVLATLRLPLFFTLSGLFAAKWVTAPLAQLWNVKLRLFVWVFLLWSLIDLGPYWIGQALHGTGINFRREILATVLSPVIPRFELWFIWALAVFFLLNRAMRGCPNVLVIVVAAFLSVVGFLNVLPIPSPGWTGLLKYYIFFFGGMVFRDLLFRFAARSGWGLRVVVVVAWCAMALGVTAAGWTEVPGVMPALGVIGVLAGISVSTMLSRLPALVSLGSRTLVVYVAHTPIIILLSAIGVIPAMQPILEASAAIYPLCVAAAAIVLALGLQRASRPARLGFLFEPPAQLAVIGTK